MSRLVFWYGFAKDDLSNAFSFIHESKIISYEEACSLGCTKVPTKIQKKIDQGKRLTGKEQYTVNGLEHIKQDSALPKEQRTMWLFEFDEDYDEYLDQLDDLASEQGEEEELTKNSKKQKRERKGKRKLDEHNLTKSKKKQKSRSLDDEIDAEVKGETEMDFDDVPSDDDKHDDDFSMSDSDSDEDFQGDDHGPSAKTKVSSSKKADKEVTTKEPKKRGRPKKPKSEVEIAQENFELCEKIFLPLMKKLKDCNFSNDAEKYIKLIAADVDALTPSFIRNHQIGILIKDIRSKFKNNQNINHQCKSLTAAMKKVFHEKSESEPVDFKPKLKAEKKSKASNENVGKVDQDTKSTKEELPVSKSTPMKAVPVQLEEKVIIPVSEDSNSEMKAHKEKSKPVKVETKPPRKSFSLANMFEQKDVSSQATANDQHVDVSTPQQQSLFEKPPAPKWLTQYNSTGASFETDPDRVYAMQFLLDATTCLPESKVDRVSVARALEDALYTKYDGDLENYMQRLHDICAAIAGKKQMGSVAQKIISGDYHTPVEVINIPRKLLFQSFEGFWIP